MHSRLLALISLGFIALASFGSAQEMSINDLLSGTVAPSTIKIAELSADFKAVRLHIAGESQSSGLGSIFGLAMSSSGGAGGGGGPQGMASMMSVMALADLYWTKGQSVKFGGHDFLVTYRLNTGLDPSGATGAGPKMAASLSLDLIRTDLISTLAPEPMTPDALQKTLKAGGVTPDVEPVRIGGATRDDTITAAILVPVFMQARTAARETSTLSNAKQIALANLMYANDYDDVYPYAESTADVRKVTEPYYKDKKIWETMNPNGGEFRFAMNLAGVSATTIDAPAEAPMIYESKEWPDGRRTVAFADGHAKLVSRQQWLQIEPMLAKKYPKTAKRPIKVG